jgi:short subunit dehydrogenase-like uncharacterized protein
VSGTILIYGATGYTGKLIAKAAPMGTHAPFCPGDRLPSESVQARERSALRDGSVELR